MRIKPEQIGAHLKRALAPVYLVFGDEPLQVAETCDVIRAAARAQGYGAREILHAGPGFDWAALTLAASNLSLFAERRLLELRIPGGKPGEAGAEALVNYAAQPAPDTLLLVVCPKLDGATQKSKWFGALEQAGVVVQVWPVTARELPAWIMQRAPAKGMRLSQEAAALLALRVEGNLLAAAQDLEKLYLLHGAAQLDADTVAAAVADSARFDVYDLADSALSGDAPRAARILNGLRGEGVEPTLVLWALARELRALAGMAHECRGANVEQVLVKYHVWDKRKAVIKKALQGRSADYWRGLLRHAARVDRVIKGIATGAVWDELLQLSVGLAGVRPLRGK